MRARLEFELVTLLKNKGAVKDTSRVVHAVLRQRGEGKEKYWMLDLVIDDESIDFPDKNPDAFFHTEKAGVYFEDGVYKSVGYTKINARP